MIIKSDADTNIIFCLIKKEEKDLQSCPDKLLSRYTSVMKI